MSKPTSRFTQRHRLRPIAVLLALVFLSLSGAMTVRMEGHALHHGHARDHAAQHASFVCIWMCSATNFVQAAEPVVGPSRGPLVEQFKNHTEPVRSNLSIFALHTRPPPSSLS